MIVNVPVAPGASVEGDTVAMPRSRTSPRVEYQVRAAPTPVTVDDPVFFTVPCSVTVPSPLPVRVIEVRLSDRDDAVAPVVTE